MKRIIACFLLITALAALAACSNGSAGDTAPTTAGSPHDSETAAETSASGVDIDLTEMSSTMVFAEVQNMMLSPDKYKGKTVKMNGALSVTNYNDKYYFACIIADATACCAQGIEFDWAGDHSYPLDYPAPDSDITVTGTFTTYIEDGNRYCQLADADLQF